MERVRHREYSITSFLTRDSTLRRREADRGRGSRIIPGILAEKHPPSDCREFLRLERNHGSNLPNKSTKNESNERSKRIKNERTTPSHERTTIHPHQSLQHFTSCTIEQHCLEKGKARRYFNGIISGNSKEMESKRRRRTKKEELERGKERWKSTIPY